MKSYIISGIIALIVSLCVVGLAPEFVFGRKTIKIEHLNSSAARSALYTLNEDNEIVPLDFTSISEQVMDAVVHIKSTQTAGFAGPGPQPYHQMPDPFRHFFRDDFFDHFFGPYYREMPRQEQSPQVRVGTGSGVIINSDGYIVTNYHVIAHANDIEVTLHDNRTYKATVIGTDTSTDLALLQIKEKKLPYLPLVNSDDVRVGEWVLAVGNPFNLNSTVTAGIVSAKSRSINVLRDQYAIESFIQTDAAINPGNSGGALVNLQGGLIGINTAIASPTGAYAGYGFAVPSNIVSKVVEDLLQYGLVQRGYLGITIRGVDGNLAREKGLKVNQGVYVDSVAENSAGFDAGIKAGDVILEINGVKVRTASELQEIVARHRPGDELGILLNRAGKNIKLKAKLKSEDGKTSFLAQNKKEILNILGADFEEIDKSTARKLGIKGGIKVSKLYAGKLRKHTNMREGFIITGVDGNAVKSLDEFTSLMESKKGGVMLEGIYENMPGVHYYAFGL